MESVMSSLTRRAPRRFPRVLFQMHRDLDEIQIIPSEKIQIVGAESIDGLTEPKNNKLVWIFLGLDYGMDWAPIHMNPCLDRFNR